MKAIRFNATIPRYALGLALGKIFPGLLWSGLSCTYTADLPEPDLPGQDWALIRTRYGGICGSDLSAIHLHTSPYGSAYVAFPYTFGHENTGSLVQAGPSVAGFSLGERVVVEPTLWCRPRGFTNLCRYCAKGEINRCDRTTQGILAPGLSTGYCPDTGGSWSQYFLAHSSQIYPLPDHLSDENALMVEPFAVGLHAALQNYPGDDQTVLLIGAGAIGLCTLAALRALGSRAHLIVLARYPFQAEAARKLGADEIVSARGHDYYADLAECLHARLLKPVIGKQVFQGGADLTFECAGNDASLDDALRLTRAGGRVVLVGVPGLAKGVDWMAIFLQELDVRAAYIYHHNEEFCGQKWKTFDLAIHLLSTGAVDLSWMVTHKFRIDDYAQALGQHTGTSHAIKPVFEFPP